MIKRKESDVGDIGFAILTKTVLQFFGFIFFTAWQILHNSATRYSIAMGFIDKWLISLDYGAIIFINTVNLNLDAFRDKIIWIKRGEPWKHLVQFDSNHSSMHPQSAQFTISWHFHNMFNFLVFTSFLKGWM